jgi:hypothetical protein
LLTRLTPLAQAAIGNAIANIATTTTRLIVPSPKP